MPTKVATIRDVAESAGVSTSTVSRVLSGTETAIAISEETRERVLRYAEELNYRPNPSARSLRGKYSDMLGLIVRRADDPFFDQLIEEMRDAAKDQGAEILVGYAESDPDEALRLRDIMLDMRHCDGLFLLGDLQASREDESFLSRMGSEFPLVFVCRGSRQLRSDIPSISTDNRKGALLALQYLAGLGHRKIAFIGAGRLGDLDERCDTYRQFMIERFGAVFRECSEYTDNSLQGGYEAMSSLLASSDPPTAIFAADDVIAIGALRAAAVHHCQVPDDISVIGFDDIKLASYLSPALTTIHQPIAQLGRDAVRIMFDMFRDRATKYTMPYMLEPQLIVRESCAQPRNC